MSIRVVLTLRRAHGIHSLSAPRRQRVTLYFTYLSMSRRIPKRFVNALQCCGGGTWVKSALLLARRLYYQRFEYVSELTRRTDSKTSKKKRRLRDDSVLSADVAPCGETKAVESLVTMDSFESLLWSWRHQFVIDDTQTPYFPFVDACLSAAIGSLTVVNWATSGAVGCMPVAYAIAGLYFVQAVVLLLWRPHSTYFALGINLMISLLSSGAMIAAGVKHDSFKNAVRANSAATASAVLLLCTAILSALLSIAQLLMLVGAFIRVSRRVVDLCRKGLCNGAGATDATMTIRDLDVTGGDLNSNAPVNQLAEAQVESASELSSSELSSEVSNSKYVEELEQHILAAQGADEELALNRVSPGSASSPVLQFLDSSALPSSILQAPHEETDFTSAICEIVDRPAKKQQQHAKRVRVRMA